MDNVDDILYLKNERETKRLFQFQKTKNKKKKGERKMKEETRKEVKKLIELNEITKKDSPTIEEIADRFPDEYFNDQGYVAFQQEIAEMI